MNISAKNDNLKRLDVSNGLSQNKVNVIYEDHLGLIWIGTNDGLNRFEGKELVTYFSDHNNKCALKGDKILDIKEDNKSRLWLASSGYGLTYYDYKTNCFVSPNISYKNSQNQILKFVIDTTNNTLWAATDGGGIFSYNYLTKRKKDYSTKNNSKFESDIFHSIEIFDGHIFAGNTSGQMLFLNPKNGINKVYKVSESQITSLKKYNNKFLISTIGNGYYLYDTLSKQINQDIFDKNRNRVDTKVIVSNILQTSESSYILSQINGIVYIDILQDTINITKTINRKNNNLEYDSFITSFVDSKGTEWFGSNGFGLYYMNTFFNTFKTLKNNSKTNGLSFSSVRAINSIDNNLWIGGYGGLNLFNFKNNTITNIPTKEYDDSIKGWTDYLNSKAIYSIYIDPFKKETVWLGSEGNGLHKYSKVKNQFKSVRIGINYGIEENINSVFCFDKYEKNFILGTTNGIYAFEPTTETYSRLDEINRILNKEVLHVKSLFVKDHYIYFVAEGLDVYIYNLKLAKLERLASSFPEVEDKIFNSINSINLYNNSIIVCTKESGLFLLDFKTNDVKHFYRGNGLINNCVYEVISNDKNLWVSTNKGISNINLISESITNYNSDIFELNTEFNLNASFKLNNNYFFGGTDGVVYLNPKDLINSKYKSDIIIKSVGLNDRQNSYLYHFVENDTIYVNFLDDLVEIEFITNEYLYEKSLKYTCKLNNGISEKVLNNRIKLLNLNEGLNKIKIDIYDSVGDISETKHFYVNVNSPYWTSKWLYFVIVFIIVLVLTSLYFKNTKKLKMRLLSVTRENKQLQNQNQEKSDKLKLLDSYSSTIIWQSDLDFNLIYSTSNFRNYYKIDSKDSLNLKSIYLTEDLNYITKNFLSKNNFKNRLDINIFHKQSILLEKEYSIVKIFKNIDNLGNIIGFFGVIKDDTDNEKTNKELYEKEVLFSTLVGTILEPVLITTWEGEILFANNEAKSVLEITINEIPEKNLFEYCEQGYQVLRKEIYAVKSGDSFEKKQFELIVGKSSKKIEGSGSQIIYLGRNLFLFTFRDVTQRINLINELTLAKINAERSSELKTMYLSNLTHELKTPINAISGFTDILLSKYKDTKNIQYLDSIKLSTNLLIQLINDLLYYTKAESGKLELRLAPTNLKSLMLELGNIFNLEIENKGLKLDLIVNTNGIDYQLSLDQLKFKQIIINLLNNSIKHTEKGKISVTINLSTISESQVNLELIVEDTGRGIPKDRVHDIFNAFKQVNLSDEREGFGLGLAIVSRILQTMNGKISVSSELGQGSRFTVYIKNINLVLNKSKNTQSIHNNKLVEEYISNDDKLSIYSFDLLEEISIVLNGRFTIKLKNIKTNFLLKDISDFASQLNNLANEKEINFLSQYSKELLDASKTIEVEKINNLLENFYKLLELINKLLEKRHGKE